ncbi:MAG: hypothetical protein II997_03870 [Clostridia bacterium]|nr:hypothetical protein [Clostridia bacterium]
MKRKVLSILMMLYVTSLCGCSNAGNTPNNDDFLNDYKQYIGSSDMEFEQVEVIKEQLFKENKKFNVEVKFTGKDDYANYEKITTLTYNYYDDVGWTLEDETTHSHETKCFKGRSITELEDDIQKNYSNYVDACKDMRINEVGGISNNNEQIITVSCLLKDGKVIGTYDNTTLLFAYENGKWNFIESRLSNASNYFLDIVGTKWHSEMNSSGKREGETIEIISVSDDSKTIIFKYGEISCTANFAGEYNDFKTSHVKYIPKEKIYLGEAKVISSKYKVYLQEIRFATFAGAGNDSIIIEGRMDGWNGYDPTRTYFYNIIN